MAEKQSAKHLAAKFSSENFSMPVLFTFAFLVVLFNVFMGSDFQIPNSNSFVLVTENTFCSESELN